MHLYGQPLPDHEAAHGKTPKPGGAVDEVSVEVRQLNRGLSSSPDNRRFVRVVTLLCDYVWYILNGAAVFDSA